LKYTGEQDSHEAQQFGFAAEEVVASGGTSVDVAHGSSLS
jgi:hypothetical protein